MFRGLFEGWHPILLILVVVLIFGANRLPGAARNIAQSMKIFKRELESGDDKATGTSATTPAAPTPAAPAPTPPPVAQPDVTPPANQPGTTPPAAGPDAPPAAGGSAARA